MVTQKHAKFAVWLNIAMVVCLVSFVLSPQQVKAVSERSDRVSERGSVVESGAAAATGSSEADDRMLFLQAVDSAIGRLQPKLGEAASRLGPIHVAVLPIIDDSLGYVTESVSGAVSRTDFKLFVRDEEEINRLVAEIEWGVRRSDIMNPETIQKFNRFEGVDAILYGRLWDQSSSFGDKRFAARLTLTLASVETGQVLWTSGPIDGVSYLHWSEGVALYWHYPALALGGLVVLVVVLSVVRRLMRLISHANRPL